MDVDPAFWRGKRVLLTGHTGFKGSWLALWLASMGAEVTGFSDIVPTEPSLFELARVGSDVRDLRGDVRDFEAVSQAVAGAEIVLHLAAQPIVRRSFVAPRETYEVNVMGTVNVFEAARSAEGVRAVINVTSDKCYENREWEWAYREDEPMGGHDPYSSSKGASELVTSAWRRSFGLPLASARAGNVIGGGDWGADRLIPDVMRAAVAGAPVEIRNPGATRPWQHVLNPLSGYLVLAQALWSDVEAATAWNFGPPEGEAKPVSWIVERLDALWPGGLRWEHDAGEHPHEATYLKVDSSRARARLGWAPRWGLERTLEAVVEWYAALRDGADMRAVTLAQLEAFNTLTAR
ncbi:MAG TPA: CDP-glucose 4,6-dehydratase [Solirubrobacter sp.]